MLSTRLLLQRATTFTFSSRWFKPFVPSLVTSSRLLSITPSRLFTTPDSETILSEPIHHQSLASLLPSPSSIQDPALSEAFTSIIQGLKLLPDHKPKRAMLETFLDACLTRSNVFNPEATFNVIQAWYLCNLRITSECVTKALTLFNLKDPFHTLSILGKVDSGLIPSVSDLESLLETFLLLQRQGQTSGSFTTDHPKISTFMAGLATFGLFEAYFHSPTLKACQLMLALTYESEHLEKIQVMDAILLDIKGALVSFESEWVRMHFYAQQNEWELAIFALQSALSLPMEKSSKIHFDVFDKQTLIDWFTDLYSYLKKNQDLHSELVMKAQRLIKESNEKKEWASILNITAD